jgi:hypothetical protein
MALFRRNRTEEAAMPPEVQSYYQAENRERAWVAWLLAIATLFATVLVVLGLYFGGRWAYRKINNTDNKNTATVQTDTAKDKNTTAPTNPSQPTSSNPSSPSTPTAPTNTGSTAAPATSGTTTAPGAQARNPNLPNTGPGDILAIFIVTSIAGAIFYDRVVRTRSLRP